MDLSGHHSNPPKPLGSLLEPARADDSFMSSRAGRRHTGRFEHVGRRRSRCCFARHPSVSAATELTPRALQATPSDDRAGLRTHQAQPQGASFPTPRKSRLPLRVAPHYRHPQPPEAPPPPHSSRGRLKAPAKHRLFHRRRSPQRAELPRRLARHHATASVPSASVASGLAGVRVARESDTLGRRPRSGCRAAGLHDPRTPDAGSKAGAGV